MRLKLSAFAERLRASLFVVPMLAVIAAIALGIAALEVDRRFLAETKSWPIGLTSTVESARALLSTVAGATITFAGIAFSISLLTIQLASSQYSPRIVHTLFRDPFNRRVMALVVGTFAYCLIVLRSVRSAIEEGGRPVIPNLSVAIALVLGITTILAVVAFINHSAHSMDVSEILERVRRETIGHVHREWQPLDADARPPHAPVELQEPRLLVRFNRAGWVQEIDTDALLDSLEPGATMQLETIAGRYAITGTPLCLISPPPADTSDAERAVHSAVAIGSTRTMQQDVSYGLRQLADVSLKALSPGVNDPTTAQDAIFHAAAVLGEMLQHEPPPHVIEGPEQRRLLMPQQLTYSDLVHLTFEETRRAAASQPTVCVYLLEAMELVCRSLDGDGHALSRAAIEEQARLVLEGCEAADLIPHDLAEVRRAYQHRFASS